MRIDRLLIENFKKFKRLEVEFPERLTLLVGENGAGKTAILDALAVAASIWLVEPPDSRLIGSSRNILRHEIRLEPERRGDRVQFRQRRPVSIDADGWIFSKPVHWSRKIRATGTRTTNAGAKEALAAAHEAYHRDSLGDQVAFPVIAYYGAGRAWLRSNEPKPRPVAAEPAWRWAAFYDCLNERIRFEQLRRWFQREAAERGNRKGEWRPGFLAVRDAILRAVPDATDIWFDVDLDQIVLSIGHIAQPFDNLSAGQRMMLALVADLAIKMVNQNAFLVADDPSRVLEETQGLVLVDELDVHLHPKWQRRVASDLKTVFPSIQFVCTSHSPQVIGELKPSEILLLDDSGVGHPPSSYGLDSSRVLKEIMDAPNRTELVQQLLDRFARLIDSDHLQDAQQVLDNLESQLGESDPEVVRGRSLLSFLGTAT